MVLWFAVNPDTFNQLEQLLCSGRFITFSTKSKQHLAKINKKQTTLTVVNVTFHVYAMSRAVLMKSISMYHCRDIAWLERLLSHKMITETHCLAIKCEKELFLLSYGRDSSALFTLLRVRYKYRSPNDNSQQMGLYYQAVICVFTTTCSLAQLAVRRSVMVFSYYDAQTLILTTEQHLWACLDG